MTDTKSNTDVVGPKFSEAPSRAYKAVTGRNADTDEAVAVWLVWSIEKADTLLDRVKIALSYTEEITRLRSELKEANERAEKAAAAEREAIAEQARLYAGHGVGWRLVPIRPTEAMNVAAVDAYRKTALVSEIWKACLAAAPPAPDDREPVSENTDNSLNQSPPDDRE